jgi:hypothetical protein
MKCSTKDVLAIWRSSRLYLRIKQHDGTDEPTSYLDARTLDTWRDFSPEAIDHAMHAVFCEAEKGMFEGKPWQKIWRYATCLMKIHDDAEDETPEDIRAALAAAILAERCVADHMFRGSRP